MGRKILVLHGPNLNLLGKREPEIYGKATLGEIDGHLAALGKSAGAELAFFQSNDEGALVDKIQKDGPAHDALLINAAGLTHTSVALRDALIFTGKPFVEVHLSNVFKREDFRHKSYLSNVALGVITGFGPASYRLGLDALLSHLDPKKPF